MGPSAGVNVAVPPVIAPGRLGAWLRLGRVSNLPTVWANALAAFCLSGETQSPGAVVVGMALMSGFYVAGMILNDAFDAAYDAEHRPLRPIPRGVISRRLALGVGLAMLTTSIAGVGGLAYCLGQGTLVATALAIALASVIVAYDVYHKQNPLSPVVMGACRALVYVTVAWAVSSELSAAVLTASWLQWVYVIGLTYAAKQEDLGRPGSFWPVLFVLAAPGIVAARLTGLANSGLLR